MANPTDKLPPVEEISPDGTPTGLSQAAPSKSHVVPPVQPTDDKVIIPEKKEELEQKVEPEINLDAFNDVKDSAEVAAARELKKTEEAAKVVVTTIPPAKEQKSAQRDYSDLPEEDKPLFERMSNEAFTKLKPAYKEYLELKTKLPTLTQEQENLKKQLEEAQKGVVKIPESYYAHKDAYVLTPEFSQAATQANEAQVIYNHWKSQLLNVRKGAKEIDFLDRDPRSGQLVITKKLPADIDSETQLLEWVDYARDMASKTSGQVEAIRQTYGAKYQESAKVLQQQEAQYFGTLFDSDEKKKIYEPLVQQQLETLPVAFRNTPMAQFTAKALAMNFVLARILNQQGGQQQQQQQVKVPSKQPSAAEIAGEVGSVNTPKKGEDVTTDDFQKVKDGY